MRSTRAQTIDYDLVVFDSVPRTARQSERLKVAVKTSGCDICGDRGFMQGMHEVHIISKVFVSNARFFQLDVFRLKQFNLSLQNSILSRQSVTSENPRGGGADPSRKSVHDNCRRSQRCSDSACDEVLPIVSRLSVVIDSKESSQKRERNDAPVTVETTFLFVHLDRLLKSATSIKIRRSRPHESERLTLRKLDRFSSFRRYRN